MLWSCPHCYFVARMQEFEEEAEDLQDGDFSFPGCWQPIAGGELERVDE